jgi:hypothetical protein
MDNRILEAPRMKTFGAKLISTKILKTFVLRDNLNYIKRKALEMGITSYRRGSYG